MPAPSSKPKILVVDDEQVIADTLAIILKHSGFEARTAYSGETSLEVAATFQPDTLLTDVIMSDGINGIEAAIQIRAMLPKCKVLLISGQAATADLMDGARSRGHDFEILAKPIHPAELISRLRR